MVDMGLIRQVATAKQTKGTGTVPIFQFTIIGRVVSWIVESLNPAKRRFLVSICSIRYTIENVKKTVYLERK